MEREALGPLFVAPQSPDWFWLLVVLVALPALGGAAAGLVRGRLSPAVGVAGIGVPALFAYLLGNLYLMEQAKAVSFCGSCHVTMGPIAQSLRQDQGYLASAHVQRGAVSRLEACYQCHSGYGIWGSLHAKVAGVKHMLRTATRTYRFPIAHGGRFDIDSCLNCHAEARPFRAVETHRDPAIQELLLSGEMGCTGTCHVDPHPPEALLGARGG